MNKYHIPSYEECQEICKKYPSMTFYEKKKLCDDYKFSFFSYRFAEYKHFSESNAFEMKGITFLHHGGEHKHYLMFNKFWELDQYPEFAYEHFKDKKIKRVMVKEDGNLVSFIKLPNGKIVSRVKEGFRSRFNITANKFIEDNPKYYTFIDYCIENDIVPLFELVGENRVVLKYEKNDLILLNLRNNSTGEYIDYLNYDLDRINVVENQDYTLEEIIEMAKTMEEFEGWVVQFEDDTLLKVKTRWYYELTEYMLEKLNMTRKKPRQSV